MTIVKKPEIKTNTDAIKELRNSTPVSEFERMLNNLFLSHLGQEHEVFINEAKAAEIIQKNKKIIKPDMNELADKPRTETPLQKYLRRNSARGSSSPRISSFKRMNLLHKNKKQSQFMKDSPRADSTKKFDFVEIKSDNEKPSNKSIQRK